MQSFYVEAQKTIDQVNDIVNNLLWPDEAKREARKALNAALEETSRTKILLEEATSTNNQAQLRTCQGRFAVSENHLLDTCRDTHRYLSSYYLFRKNNDNTTQLLNTLNKLLVKRRDGQLELVTERQERERAEAEERKKREAETKRKRREEAEAKRRAEAEKHEAAEKARVKLENEQREKEAREAAEQAAKAQLEAEKKAQEERERVEKLRIEQERREAAERAEKKYWQFSNILEQINTNTITPILEIAKIRTEAGSSSTTTTSVPTINKNELRRILEALQQNTSVKIVDFSNIDITGSEDIIATLVSTRPMLAFQPASIKHLEKTPPPISHSLILSGHSLLCTKELNRGTYGSVHYGTLDGREVAIKIPLGYSPPTLKYSKDSLCHEAEMLAKFDHPNIVHSYGICLDNESLVLEYMPHGSLYQELHATKELTWTVRWTIATEISKGMQALHKHDPCIVHRDFKSDNVLLNEQNHAKISDFGSAAIFDENDLISAEEPICTLAWRAPELLDPKKPAPHTTKTDIYSLGVVLWEIASRELPWAGNNAPETLVADWICSKKRDVIPQETPPSYAALIRRCWADRPEDRPDIDTVVQILEDHRSEATLAPTQ
ncbi:MAG: protein kinase [Gammaproteobacteria bacterium]